MTINATAIWRVCPSGSNTNGGGYDPGISGAATDYSRQNAAQATGTHGTTVGTTTFTDLTALAFTAAMIGNAIYITGTGQTTGWYFVTAFTSSSIVTLDRSPGTGTLATWNLGGGWADPWTNLTSSGPLVPGNIVYVLGSGTPNPASYTYDYDTGGDFTLTSGNDTAGYVTIANDPSTPGYKAPPDTTGGMPCIRTGGLVYILAGYNKLQGLFFVLNGTSGNNVLFFTSTNPTVITGCVCDQFGNDCGFTFQDGTLALFGNEVFTSVAPGSSGSKYAINIDSINTTIIGNNIHDTVGPGILANRGAFIEGNIIAKCRGVGLLLSDSSAFPITVVRGNTIDGNLGNGMEVSSQVTLSYAAIQNNNITNHTQSGTYGFTVDAGTAAANSLVALLFDNQVWQGNTTDVNAINKGPHDTTPPSSPSIYVNQSTENYTLA